MSAYQALSLIAGLVALSGFDAQTGMVRAREVNQPASTSTHAMVASPCSAVTWTSGVSYAFGTIVKYPPNSSYYKAVNVDVNGTDATIPTISTWYWEQTTCKESGWTNKIIGGYYPNWKNSPLRLIDLNPNYNLIYLFAAQPVGGSPGTTGAVFWTLPGNGREAATNLVADINYARTIQGRKIILSVGGAGNGMDFPNRAKSQNFVDSIVAISDQLGGIDGIDWDTFEGSQAPDTSEMIWISLQLKERFPGFIVSAAPAPWSPIDKNFCQAMVEAGAMDYAAPQYYDGPNLADPAYVISNVSQWVSSLGASHVVVGFGIDNLPNYMSAVQAVNTWKQIETNIPDIRGAYDWETGTDESQNWPFAAGVGPLVK